MSYLLNPNQDYVLSLYNEVHSMQWFSCGVEGLSIEEKKGKTPSNKMIRPIITDS